MAYVNDTDSQYDISRRMTRIIESCRISVNAFAVSTDEPNTIQSYSVLEQIIRFSQQFTPLNTILVRFDQSLTGYNHPYDQRFSNHESDRPKRLVLRILQEQENTVVKFEDNGYRMPDLIRK